MKVKIEVWCFQSILWRSDEDFGEEFSKWLDKFLEKYSVSDDADNSSPNNKRPNSEVQGQDRDPSPKKSRAEEVPAECLLPCDKISETLLFETKLGGKDTMAFQIRTNHQLYLVNQTSQELTLKAMSPLVGFGRGSFKLFKEGDTLPEKGLLFQLASSDALVCLNGAVQTISEVLFNQRKIKPEATVCYHKATPSGQKTDGQTLFDFKLTHKICFVPPTKRDAPDEGAEKPSKEESLTFTNIASRESAADLQCASLIWHVRWTVKGLQPLKPMIHLTKKLCLAAGQCCKLKQ